MRQPARKRRSLGEKKTRMNRDRKVDGLLKELIGTTATD
jgi:hypothetical protein